MHTTINESDIISREELETNPEYAEMLEAMRWLEAHENDVIFPKKFLLSHKGVIDEKLRALAEENPEASFKTALFRALRHIPETLNVPADLLMELVRHTLEKWEKIKAEQFAEMAA